MWHSHPTNIDNVHENRQSEADHNKSRRDFHISPEFGTFSLGNLQSSQTLFQKKKTDW